jgi:phosphatidylglycerophosphate synthase
VYSLLYSIVFGLDVLLIIFCMGLLVASCAIYWVRRNHAADTRYYFGALILLNAGLAYLFLGAVFSLFGTSLHHNDPTIFLFPPGLVLVATGVIRKVRYYSRGKRP